MQIVDLSRVLQPHSNFRETRCKLTNVGCSNLLPHHHRETCLLREALEHADITLTGPIVQSSAKMVASPDLETQTFYKNL